MFWSSRALAFTSLLTVLASISMVANAQQTLSAEDKSRVIALAERLEANPLDKALTSEREWALKRLIEAPDISISMCPTILGDYFKYKFSAEITTQILMGSAAFILRNPGSGNDRNGVYLAAAESSLKAYEAILRQKDKTSKSLDELLAKRKDGKLKETVEQNAAKTCKS